MEKKVGSCGNWQKAIRCLKTVTSYSWADFRELTRVDSEDAKGPVSVHHFGVLGSYLFEFGVSCNVRKKLGKCHFGKSNTIVVST